MHSPSFEALTHDAGGTVNGRPALDTFRGVLAASASRNLARVGAWLTAILISFALAVPGFALAATPPGTTIQNAASVSFNNASATPVTITSNIVSATVVAPPSPSALAILRTSAAGGVATSVGATQCQGANGFATLPPPTQTAGDVIDLSQPLALATAASVHGGEAAFLQLADADQNRDANAIDVAELRLSTPGGDREVLRLSETGADTGVFVGYVQTRAATVSAGNCVLEVERNAQITSLYVDPTDARDTSSASALVDPYGLVFNSSTGAAINGARVRLIDATSGELASVVGDDGSSRYPAEMVTGAAVTDAGGTIYTLPAGVFRFPLVAPGSYRLEVDPPAGQAFPSTLGMSELAQTPGGPYRLSAGSFGSAFAVDASPAVAVDLPVDTAATQLFMQKTTTTTVAAIGDFVQYTLTLENTSGNAALASVITTDRLPQGARYREGSTRSDGHKAPDPVISADGQTLTFTGGALGAGQRTEIRYVVEITAGAKGKQLVNTARAVGPDGVASNSAQATIQLREELFRDRAILMGRVVEGDCATPAHQLQGVGDVRVYLEDGRYAMTDADGKYHFEDVMPGVHVVQLDTVTVPETHEIAACADRVRNAGRAYSQFVDVRGGALWRSDFVLERKAVPKGAVTLEMNTRIKNPSTLRPGSGSGRTESDPATGTFSARPEMGDDASCVRPEPVEGSSTHSLRHELTLNVTGIPISNARLLVMLPEGLTYRQGSAQLNDAAIADPSASSNVLSFILHAAAANSRALLTFSTEATQTATGALTLKAVVTFDTPSQTAQRTAPVENIILRGEMLYESASYRFSPRFDVLNTSIEPADRAQLDRIVPESLALNRRVEIAIEGLRVIAAGGLTVRTPSARSAAVETTGALGKVMETDAGRQAASDRLHASETAHSQPASPRNLKAGIATPDVEQLQPGTGWIFPVEGDIPAIPSIRIAIQHLPTQRVELSVNGVAVSPLNFDGVATNQARSVALSRWRGVDLRDGDNRLVAVVRDESNAEVGRLERSIHYAGGAVRAELVREQSKLIADGRTRPVIALRMVDAYGKPARPGTLGAYAVEEPYRSWWEVESLDDNKLVAVGPREPTFSVDDDGLARVTLAPTTQAGTAVVRLRFNERQQQEVRVWLEPQARDWILVGIAEGTAAYSRISERVQSAADAGLEEGYADSGRVAFFAKGAIKGEYLLTAAYDSARDHELAKDRLLGVVEPDRFYTLYGDATEQRFEAATTRKLFVKLERRQFAALFGDFATGLTVTELSRYSRTFTGLKADYAGERFGYSAFAADSQQGYVKDELQGDGTSGLYRLSQRPLIINSDKIRIEIRDRFRSEVVVESRPLTRYIDYSIDYLNGTVFFKQPVPSRDEHFNPVYIVAEYEVLNGGDAQVTAGGRAAVKFAEDRVELGASYLQEGAAAGDTRVAGTDLHWQISAATQLKAEVARSESDDPLGTAQANAYLTELLHVTEKLDAHAYVREQEPGFGVGQQLSTQAGTRKLGVDGRYHLSERFAIEAETYRQEVLDTGAERELVSAELRHESDDYTLGAGARYVADSGLPNGDTESQQAFVNGSIDLFKDLITLRASQDLSLGGSNASVDFPARSVAGVDYHWRADTTLFVEHEHANGENFDADMTRIGVRAAPWARAQLQSSMSQHATEYGPRVFANVGLTQGWQMNERWDFDFGVDQSRTVRGPQLQPFNANVPLASGTLNPNSDFLAAFAGAMYHSELWTFSSRLENRNSDDEDRWVFSGGFYREPRSGHAFSLATQFFDSRFANGSDTKAGDIQLAWVYRPANSAWIVLDRLDLKHESRADTLGEFESARAINNLNSNWQLDPHTQLGLQLAARFVRSTFDDERYSGFSSLYGLDIRRDLTARCDVGLHGTLLNSLESGVSDASVGIDVGVTVARNAWISVGYNLSGFRDEDFEASRYTAQGPFIRFRMKADQDTFKDLMLDGTRAGRQ